MSWRTKGCYVWRTRKPGSPLGLPFIGRHFAYVGETGSRYHRDRQHEYGGGRYGAVAKPWSDLAPKAYPLPCLFPSWKWSRKAQEKLWIRLLLPVYNSEWNKGNPRRIKPGTAEKQRWSRDARRARGLGQGFLVDIRVTLGRLVIGSFFWSVLGVAAWTWLR